MLKQSTMALCYLINTVFALLSILIKKWDSLLDFNAFFKQWNGSVIFTVIRLVYTSTAPPLLRSVWENEFSISQSSSDITQKVDFSWMASQLDSWVNIQQYTDPLAVHMDQQLVHMSFPAIVTVIGEIRGVTVSMSAFLACHQCYCAGSSLAWGLNLRAVVCGIFWSSSPAVFSGYSGFLPSFIGLMVQPIK